MEKFANYDCPACFKALYLSPRIYQCLNGHIICESCSGRLTNCPESQCRMSFQEKLCRNVVMEEILNDLSYPCPHRENGCMEKLSRGGIKAHGDSCIFGSTFDLCKMLGPSFAGCDSKISAGNAKYVLQHFLFCHPDNKKRIGGSKMTLRLNMKDLKKKGRKCYVMRPFPEKDDLVMVIFTFEERSVAFSVVDLSLGLSVEEDEDDDDDVRVAFSVPDEKAPLISWQISVVPGIDSWKFLKKEGNPTQFKIKKESLLQHCDADGKVRMNVKVKSPSAKAKAKAKAVGMGGKGKKSEGAEGMLEDFDMETLEWWNVDF